MLPHVRTLLRRTAAAATAVAVLLITNSAVAQKTFTLQGVTGNPSCQSAQMNVNPAGNIDIICAAVSPPVAGAAGTFALAGAPFQLIVSQTAMLSVTRNGGTTGAYRISWAASNGCSGSGTVDFADASSTAVPGTITVTAGAAAGTCAVDLVGAPLLTGGTAGTGATNATPGVTFPVVAAAPPPAAGCPTPPLNIVTTFTNGQGDFGASGTNPHLAMQSGVVASIPLPTTGLPRNSGQISQGPAIPPPGMVLETTISKCRGVIDPTAGTCYYKTTSVSWNDFPWFFQTDSRWTPGLIGAWGYCYAPTAGGPWYFNVRYTFPGTGTGDLFYTWGGGPG